MNHYKASEHLKKIESIVDVSSINYAEYNLWPPIRNRIASKLVKKNNQEDKKNKLTILYNFVRNIFHLIRSKPKMIDILLISDNAYSIEVNNNRYDRVLYGVTKKYQQSSYIVEKVFLDRLIFHDKSNYTSAFLFNSRIIAFLASNFLYFSKLLKLNIFNANSIKDIEKKIAPIISKFERNNISISSKDLIISSLSIFFHGMLIKKYFKNFKNLQIFQSNSFDPIGLAVNLAANSLKYDTYTVQHGGQSKNNPFFAFWGINHPCAKLFFSENYLCWDISSTTAIKDWKIKDFSPLFNIKGYEWLNDIKSNIIKSEQKDKLISKSENFYNIVYTLQPSYKMDESFLLSLTQLHPSIKVWLRSHPTDRLLKNHRYSYLSSKSVVTSLSDEVLLVELLSIADLHITASSSSVFEAESCNVSTIFLNSNGEKYFPEMIKRGSAQYIISETDFFNNILDKIASKNYL